MPDNEPRGWRSSLWRGETAPIPKVRAPTRAVYPRPDETLADRAAEIDQAAQMALRIGTLLLAGGAPTEDVEAAVFATGDALGLRNFEVETTYTTIVISIAPDADHPGVSDMRVVRSRSLHYARVAATHQLVLDLVEGRLDPLDLPVRLREVEHLRRPYRRWMVVLASGALSAAVTVELDGGPLTALIAFIASTVTGYVGVLLATRKVPTFFVNILLALISTLAAVGVSATDLDVKASLVVVGGIIMLLPGMSLVVASQEAIESFSVTAAARMVELTVATIGIVAGVLIGLVVADQRSIQMQVAVRPDTTPALITIGTIAAACIAITAAVTYQSPRRLALYGAMVAGIGFGIRALMEIPFDSPGVATAIPAVVIGFIAKLMGARLRVPIVLVAVPAIVPMLPGLSVYQGLLAMTQGKTLDGIGYLVNAATIAIALAGGVILGQLIGGRPSRRLLSNPLRKR